VEAGFDSERALTFHLSIPRSTYPEPEQVGTFVRSLLAELEALPGVRAAATTSSLPMSGWNSATPVLEVEGVPEPADGAGRNASFRAVSPGYVRAMGMRLLRGRDLTESDLREVAATALVNRALARELWGSRDPVGLRLELSPLEDGSENWITVVGVVGDAIEFGPDVAPPPMMYVPAVRQRDVDVVLRASGDPTALAPAVRAAFHRLDPNQPLADVGTLEERLQRATASWRFNAVAVVLFSVLALVLAATGIYGVVSYAVSQRTREIGLRLALGAARADVLRNVVGRGLRLTAIGLGVGLLGALALGRTLSGVLFGVTPTDAGVLAGTTAALALVALAASAVPALRAARLDPATTLRGE
jgi:predicted permease